MALHNKIGTDGEAFAIGYLKGCGFKILHTNWRYFQKEIDAVALDGNVLVIIEVKTRTAGAAVADVISDYKITCLVDAAEAYIARYDRQEEVRFDVVLLTRKGGGYDVEHVRDAFR